MNEIFDITGDDIKELRDDDLRELVGRLCELDYQSAALRTVGITWGGNQDAADGGLDVVVHDSIDPPANSYIPRRYTGFQVKKPSMGPSAILKEMRPQGVLRESIKTLIDECGAYIVVSSMASSTDSAVVSRRNAMREAISDVDGHENLHVDFYDSGRIATWVRSHPTLILWVRKKIGRSQQGWQPYGNWSASPQGLNDTYLLDDGLRLYRGTEKGDLGETAVGAVQYLRDKLSQPKLCLRLVGLSGVGKTRFAQTIFDASIGTNALNPAIAVYADISDSPMPDPISLARRLMDGRTQAVMIIDNCPPDLHKRLVQVCAESESTISLFTIEYDVRDDLPEETDVLRLEAASEELIRKLIERRLPFISQPDAHTIAEFSGGNASVAIALASTMKRGETLGRLRDEDLFKRLFHQKHDPNEDLLIYAQAISLLYSFEGTDTKSTTSELCVLADIIERPVIELYRSVSELQRRQLVQSRSVWRAVLPHAIANRLAEQALKSLPMQRILDAFMQLGHERLLRSFTRRLGFLHDNEETKNIASIWLSHNGWLGKTDGNLSDLGFEIMKNIAPVSPDKVLAMMEHWANTSTNTNFISQENHRRTDYVRILRHIAYDSALFSRSATLICRFALTDKTGDRGNPIRESLKSLFYIYLSGTHAPTDVRAITIKNLWDSGEETQQELALYLLGAAYEALHFTTQHENNFGARPRDWGWQPDSQNDVVFWYSTFLSLGIGFALSTSPMAVKAKKLLAENFLGMWSGADIHDELETMCDQLITSGPWNDGWIAVRLAIQFNTDKKAPEDTDHLYRIEEKLRPLSLLEKVRTYVLSDQEFLFDLDDIEQDIRPAALRERTENTIKDLGRKVATDLQIFSALLPNLVTTQNNRLWDFGMGLAEGTSDKMKLWTDIWSACEKSPEEKIRVQCLMGVLSSESMNPIREEIMESLVDDTVLGAHFPHIQMASTVTPQALARLNRALEIGKAPIGLFRCIAWGRAHETVSDDDLASYVQKILSKDEGWGVAMDILHMRLNRLDKQYSEQMIATGRDLLAGFPSRPKRQGHFESDYHLADLADKCLRGTLGREVASILCKSMAGAEFSDQAYAIDYPLLLAKLAELHPILFLDAFLLGEAAENRRTRWLSLNGSYHGENPLERISDSDKISWCKEDATHRYPLMASTVNYFKPTSQPNSLTWNPILFELLKHAPDISEILQAIDSNFKPTMWSGSMADILTKRAEVLRDLFNYENEAVASWAKNKYDAILSEAESTRKWEEGFDRQRNETFE